MNKDATDRKWWTDGFKRNGCPVPHWVHTKFPRPFALALRTHRRDRATHNRLARQTIHDDRGHPYCHPDFAPGRYKA